MLDGSDAIADWPILNALINTAAGAHWVSVHHGGGVRNGYSIHAGMVVVADGSDDARDRLERVLTTDPGMGVIRHADAGYERALEVAAERGVRNPHARTVTESTSSPWAAGRMSAIRCSATRRIWRLPEAEGVSGADGGERGPISVMRFLSVFPAEASSRRTRSLQPR